MALHHRQNNNNVGATFDLELPSQLPVLIHHKVDAQPFAFELLPPSALCIHLLSLMIVHYCCFCCYGELLSSCFGSVSCVAKLIFLCLLKCQGTPVNIIVGSHVWVEDPELAWIDAQVVQINGGEATLVTTEGTTVSCQSPSFSFLIAEALYYESVKG